MKFAEHLLAHITPEWRRQYIVYEDMKTMLYEAISNMPGPETADVTEIERLIKSFEEDFFGFCDKELFKINVFYEEKLAEGKRRFDALKKEMDALALQYQASRNRPSMLSRLSIGRLWGGGGDPDLNRRKSEGAALRMRKTSGSKEALNPERSSQFQPSSNNGRRFGDGNPEAAHSRPNPLAHNRVSISVEESNSNAGVSSPTKPTLSQRKLHQTSGFRAAAVISSRKISDNKSPKITFKTSPNHANYGTLSTAPGMDRKKLQDLKLAFSEFYLSLVLLQNYQRLNYTGFRKIFKKHDKLIGNEDGRHWFMAHVETAFFHTNKDVDKLIEDTENIVTFQLESGDRQKAMKRLRVPPLNDPPKPWTAFRVGFYLGAFLTLAVAVALSGMFQQTGDDWRIVFRLYRSPLFIILFIFLVGVNIYGWRTHGVNHVLIFELDPRDHLSSQDLLELSFSFGMLWCIFVLVFLWSEPLGIPQLLTPMILYGIMVIYLLNPTKTFNHTARFWLIGCIIRIATAPFHRVRFCDFWLADQLNSMVTVLLDIEYASCFYLTSSDFYGNTAWWRFAQCMRRYFDEGRRANPHLLNAGKYSTVWLVVIFSTLTEYHDESHTLTRESPFFICWILSMIMSSCYTYVWDIKMDWGLMDPKAPPEYKFLREELVYPVRYYYFAIGGDLILRFGWAFNLSLTEVGGIPQDMVILVLQPLEVLRRFLWNFYRLENEHLNNCGEFRAVRDISISGQNIDTTALNRILKIMDEPDGLALFRQRVRAQMLASKRISVSDPSVVLII